MEWLQVADVPVADGTVTVRHDGHVSTTFTNRSDETLLWEARFLGEHRWLEINGRRLPGRPEVIDGVRHTVVKAPVRPGRTAGAKILP
ncbi:hypothetical protein [Nonomuraea sp. NPDC050643]|uniref:hypothetical protein n=1 Tax=Nonomuraea sp. NPDC050643 TaxID=3155660 RepID=UPI0033DAA941